MKAAQILTEWFQSSAGVAEEDEGGPDTDRVVPVARGQAAAVAAAMHQGATASRRALFGG
jgi:hypothetical protein